MEPVTVDVVPPLLQALAAFAATVALTFVGRRYVSPIVSGLVVACALVLVVGTGVWGYAARKAHIDRSTGLGKRRKSQLSGGSGHGWQAC